MRWGDEQDSDLSAYFWYLSHLRREHLALWRGSLRHSTSTRLRAPADAYAREDGTRAVVVGLNLSDEPREFAVPGDVPRGGRHLQSSAPQRRRRPFK